MAAGADIILLPAPGTVPGITQEYAHRLIEVVHSRGKLALTAIGTSQEGADVATIRQIALMCKMAGADIHHIGDTGVPGMALPQNIMAYSIAIRGERHTYHKIGTVGQPLIIANCPQEFCVPAAVFLLLDCGNTRTGRRRASFPAIYRSYQPGLYHGNRSLVLRGVQSCFSSKRPR